MTPAWQNATVPCIAAPNRGQLTISAAVGPHHVQPTRDHSLAKPAYRLWSSDNANDDLRGHRLPGEYPALCDKGRQHGRLQQRTGFPDKALDGRRGAIDRMLPPFASRPTFKGWLSKVVVDTVLRRICFFHPAIADDVSNMMYSELVAVHGCQFIAEYFSDCLALAPGDLAISTHI